MIRAALLATCLALLATPTHADTHYDPKAGAEQAVRKAMVVK